MGLVEWLFFVLMLPVLLVLTSPLTNRSYYTMDGRECTMCPAGEYQKSCRECELCPDGSFTPDWNREDSCHDCFSDCRSDYHLKVVQGCTNTSDLKCICEAGYRCTSKVPYSENCRYCDKIQTTLTTTTGPTVIPHKDKQRQDSTEHNVIAFTSCLLPECVPHPVTPAGNVFKLDNTNNQLVAILCPVVAIGCVAIVILFCFVHPGNETCFKRVIAKFYSEGDTSHKLESSHHGPRDSSGTKQQPSSSSFTASNLGAVHVHNPGTVIFSLLSQFTGQIGSSRPEEETAERATTEEEEEEEGWVLPPVIHLSQEERSAHSDGGFFPSQEQGKDCHMSQEEALHVS
ncbi:uncharacterized protein si:dkey-260g12.1 [Thalassophryne amazonica]|uniref:uncharacterized protein si:dkey-260g12.1 n=1 Tax=Thalassophryne amazonica TaxID=390379 RepID=UPI001472446C|nr:uncharacterized protein si:dkey-260g12.1 [Thalassophryne amazonica]XP_034030409.1 uncharacterized protein si:dkey-260g12.1 [Thalassophryne amazonica]